MPITTAIAPPSRMAALKLQEDRRRLAALKLQEDRRRFDTFAAWCAEYKLYSIIQNHQASYKCTRAGHLFTMSLEETQWRECPHCTEEYKQYGAFYLVLNPVTSIIKLGISRGLAKGRLSDHRSHGFTCLLRLLSCEQYDKAPNLEVDVLTMLRSRQINPVWGREYFSLTALSHILEMVDSDNVLSDGGFTSIRSDGG